MTPLLVITAGLLLLSGLVKLKAAERVGLGIAVLPLVELLAAVALGALAVVHPLTPRGGLVAVVLALVLLVGSSVQVGAAVRRRNRRRTLSEGARLHTYVQYLSAASEPDASDPTLRERPGE